MKCAFWVRSGDWVFPLCVWVSIEHSKVIRYDGREGGRKEGRKQGKSKIDKDSLEIPDTPQFLFFFGGGGLPVVYRYGSRTEHRVSGHNYETRG